MTEATHTNFQLHHHGNEHFSHLRSAYILFSCETYKSTWDSLKVELRLESFDQTSEIANNQLS